MPLIELVISVCAVANPQNCRDIVHPDVKRASQLECVLSAPIETAKWEESHPQWQVKKTECKRVSS